MQHGHSTTTNPNAAEIVSILADPNATLADVTEGLDLTPTEAVELVRSPGGAAALRAARELLSIQRDLAQARAEIAALNQLADLAAHPTDYGSRPARLTPQAAEIARKAASTILRGNASTARKFRESEFETG
ncbi:MAG: hypothetical protein AAFU70_13925, partial [Planctomycetota bacterium]